MNKVMAQIREWLTSKKIDFVEGAETFMIDGDGPKPFRYVPSFMISGWRAEGKPVIIEPIMSASLQGAVKRMMAFRRQFEDKYYVVIVTKKSILDKLPKEVGDQLIALEEMEHAKIKHLRAV